MSILSSTAVLATEVLPVEALSAKVPGPGMEAARAGGGGGAGDIGVSEARAGDVGASEARTSAGVATVGAASEGAEEVAADAAAKVGMLVKGAAASASGTARIREPVGSAGSRVVCCGTGPPSADS